MRSPKTKELRRTMVYNGSNEIRGFLRCEATSLKSGENGRFPFRLREQEASNINYVNQPIIHFQITQLLPGYLLALIQKQDTF